MAKVVGSVVWADGHQAGDHYFKVDPVDDHAEGQEAAAAEIGGPSEAPSFAAPSSEGPSAVPIYLPDEPYEATSTQFKKVQKEVVDLRALVVEVHTEMQTHIAQHNLELRTHIDQQNSELRAYVDSKMDQQNTELRAYIDFKFDQLIANQKEILTAVNSLERRDSDSSPAPPDDPVV